MIVADIKQKRRNNDIRISQKKQFIACFRSSETERDCKDNDEMDPLEEGEGFRCRRRRRRRRRCRCRRRRRRRM